MVWILNTYVLNLNRIGLIYLLSIMVLIQEPSFTPNTREDCINTKELGKKTKWRARENFIIKMEKFSLEDWRTGLEMDMESSFMTIIQRIHFTKASSSMTWGDVLLCSITAAEGIATYCNIGYDTSFHVHLIALCTHIKLQHHS